MRIGGSGQVKEFEEEHEDEIEEVQDAMRLSAIGIKALYDSLIEVGFDKELIEKIVLNNSNKKGE